MNTEKIFPHLDEIDEIINDLVGISNPLLNLQGIISMLESEIEENKTVQPYWGQVVAAITEVIEVSEARCSYLIQKFEDKKAERSNEE